MTLPEELSRRIAAAGGGASKVAARALYNLDGNLGETWATTDGTTLFLFTKRIGQEFALISTPLSEVDDLTVRDDGSFAYLQVQSCGRTRNLKFSIWDRRDLDHLCLCWTEVSGRVAREGTRHLRLEPVTPAHAPPAPLTPLVAFCAAVHAMIQADGNADATELFVLQTAVRDPDVIERGRQWLEQHGEAALLKEMSGLLNGEQKLCLLANVAAVGMADGLWRSKEQAFLERLQAALAVDGAQFQPVFDVVMLQHALCLFDAESAAHAGPTAPLTLLAALLESAAEADGGIGQEEQTLLWHLVDDPEISSEARLLLQRDGLDVVLRHASLLLSDQQKQCLLANLLKVAMVDGVLRSKEQALLERIRKSLGVPEGAWQAIHHALMVKSNLTVFAA